jgi:hypothetical protein
MDNNLNIKPVALRVFAAVRKLVSEEVNKKAVATAWYNLRERGIAISINLDEGKSRVVVINEDRCSDAIVVDTYVGFAYDAPDYKDPGYEGAYKNRMGFNPRQITKAAKFVVKCLKLGANA